MKIKTILAVIFISVLFREVSAQQYAVDKKATIISGSLSFTSQGGDLFEDFDGNKATTFSFTPNINHFITKNIFFGGSLELTTESQGDYKFTGTGIGPQIGVAFGGSQNKAYPYLDLGLRYYTMKSDFGSGSDVKFSGSDLSLGFGVIVPLKSHIGLIFEGGYHMMNLKDKDSKDSYSGKIFSIGAGIAGLLFKDPI
jgi:hypothetical protein